MATTEQSMDSESMQDTIIRVRDLSVTFSMERGESRVLDGVDIDINREEIIGIVGESGSGKSMFASALLNAIVEPGIATGDVTFIPESGDATDVLDLDKKQLRSYRWNDVSMVFQGAMSSFNPTQRIETHFLETLEAHGANISEGMNRAHEILSDLFLDPERVMPSYPHELSGGMQQRTLIALSLVLEPEVLVMDEPTAALDLLMQQSIIRLLKEIQEKYALTIIFITHDLPLVAGIADRFAVMYAFEFAELGSTDKILYEAKHPYTRALLNATPNLDMPTEDMRPIEGSSPDPVEIPPGCSYHPRCPLATEQCWDENPAFTDVGPEHEVTCFHWKESADAIPLSMDDEFAGEAQ